MKNSSTTRLKTAAMAGALLLGALTAPVVAQAQAPEPTPSTYTDADVPLLRSWSNINTLTVERDSQEGRTYIYPDSATRDADASGAMDGTGSVAYVGWELDDFSGRAPGIQAITDDFAFPVQNCIMASGEREADDFPGTIVPKNCSDAQWSSKRFFLEVTEADTAIDLVFDTGMGVLRYKGVKDPSEDGGEAFEEFRETHGVGRIYRVIMKFLNETGQRLSGVRVEVGTGVGADFVPLTLEDDGVGFELRQLVERGFFVGNTGAGPRSVWDPERFAHFSPKLFHDGTGRFDTGFFDVQRSGFFYPQSISEGDESAQMIYSGDMLNANTGIYGALSQNYFSMFESQGGLSDLVANIFGYFLSGELSPYVIDRHNDGNPLTEGDLTMAWWDGNVWRYGVDENFAEVPTAVLEQWAALQLGVDNDNPSVGPERYGSMLADDLSGMNMDVYLKIQDMILDGDGLPRHDSITMRLTGVSVDSLGVGAVAGTDDPLWVQPGHEAPALSTYMPATGVPVALNDFASTMRNVSVDVDVLENDLLDGSLVPIDPTTIVTVLQAPTNGSAVVDPNTYEITYTPAANYVGPDSFTYTVEFASFTSNAGTVSIEVREPTDDAIPVAGNDSASTIEDEPVTIDVLANDTVEGIPVMDGPNVIVTIIDAPVNGTAVVNADKTITYTANADANFTLVERFTYRVTVEGAESNAALVTVRAETDEVVIIPFTTDDQAETTGTESVVIHVLSNDTYDGLEVPESAVITIVNAPANGNATVNADGTVSYTANQGFEGVDTFTYSVSVLDVVSEHATVTVTVKAEDEEEPPTNVVPTGGQGGGCSAVGGNGAPLAALFLGLGLVMLRRRTRKARN